uniref:Histone deacetylase domain-containing protein n=1 Tax=Zea mays TaxID=4577 RepID=A0A804Q3G7_MAIZE
MKPHRIRMTHALLGRYGLLDQMQVFRPHPARDRDLCRFHADDYVSFLRSVTPETQQDQIRALKHFSVGEDCPRLRRYGDLYNENNVAISGIHTHAGPGGYL